MGEWTYPPHLYEIQKRNPVAHGILCWLLSSATNGVATYTVRQFSTMYGVNRGVVMQALNELVRSGEIEMAGRTEGSQAKVLKLERYKMLTEEDVVAPIGSTPYSELVAAAKTVLRHYRRTVRPGDNLHDSQPAIMALLEKGYTKEDLAQATDSYREELKHRYVSSDRWRMAHSFFLPEIVDSYLPEPGSTGTEETDDEKAEETGPVRSKIREAFARAKK